MAADDALIGHSLRRLEASVLATDKIAQVALQKAGFRLEGTRRQAFRSADGKFIDVKMYARLATDQVYDEGGRSGVLNSLLPTKRVIAHVVFRNHLGEVLLLETTYKKNFELPGGIVEPGETPRQGAIREVQEELGILVNLGQPTIVDWMPAYLGWSDALEFIFDGGTLQDQDFSHAIPNREIVNWHWTAPKRIKHYLSEVASNRLRTLFSSEGQLIYTENGLPNQASE